MKKKEVKKEQCTDCPYLPKDKTYIAIVLDESTSMNTVRTETIDMFNKQIENIKKESDDDTFISLVTFSTAVNTPILWNAKVGEVKELTKNNYRPNGFTAMLDAVGFTISKLKESQYANEPKTSFLLIIITDGEENCSRKETYESIAKKIQEVKDTDKWTITYLGANQDLSFVTKKMNIDSLNSLSFASDAVGVNVASSCLTKGITGYYAMKKSGLTSMKDFYGDLKDGEDKSPTQ